MPDIFRLAILPGAVAAIISLLITPLVISLAWKLGIIDDPKKNIHPKVLHTKPTPRGGGVGIFVAVATASLLFLPFDRHLAGILAGALAIIAIGLLDDKLNLHPLARLVVQFLVGALPVIAGIGITFTQSPSGGIINLDWFLSDIFTIFWIVFMMNILNLGAKGVPGQLSGVTAIAAITIAVLSLRFSADIAQWPVIILACITAGSFLGFLPWHIEPQKIMPSFGGSNLAGYLLAILAILSTAKVGTLLVVLAVPLIDTSYVIIRRIAAGKMPFWGDRGHLHHRLLDTLGWSKNQIALFYWTVTAILGVLAINLNSQFKFYTIVGVALVLGGLILWLTHRSRLHGQ